MTVAATPPLPPELRRAAVEIFNDRALAGLAVGVVRGDGVEAFEGFGLADVARGRSVTPGTVFRIGSITKTMTAIAVMQLVEDGSLRLDDPVSAHLRAFAVAPPAGGPPITIRHLLTHTGGLGELRRWRDLVRPVIGLASRVGEPVPRPAELYTPALRAEVTAGSKWAYANHGFAALGQLVEDVTGEPFATRLRTRLFEPLAMSHTDVLRSDRIAGELAIGYASRRGRLRPVKDLEIAVAGAGSVFASTSDMSLYAAALANGGVNEHGRILRDETLAAMFEPQGGLEVRGAAMGLAFFLDRLGGHRVAGHDGGWPGFVSSLLVAPDEGLGVVCFTNTSDALAPHSVAETLLGRLLGVAEEDAPEPVPASAALWPTLTGVYRPERGPNTNLRFHAATLGQLEIAIRGKALVVRAPSLAGWLRRGVRLHAVDDEDPLAFEAREAGVSVPIVFERGRGGQVDSLRIGSSRGGFAVLRRRPTWTSVRVWGGATLLGAAAATTTGVRRRVHRRSA